MNKPDLALNNLQWLICHEAKPNPNPSSYRVESWFSQMHYLLTQQRRTLDIGCGDLQLKLTKPQPTICDLSFYKSHPSNSK